MFGVLYPILLHCFIIAHGKVLIYYCIDATLGVFDLPFSLAKMIYIFFQLVVFFLQV